MLSPSQLISPRHLQRQPRANPNLRTQQLRSIPIMLNLLLNFLPDRQILLVLLLRRLLIHVSGLHNLRLLSVAILRRRSSCLIRLLHVLRLRLLFLLNRLLGLFRVEPRGRE